MTIAQNHQRILATLRPGVSLTAVSKYQSVAQIQELYDAQQRIFAESRAQELQTKVRELPADIEWHFIGPLQTNKVKMVVPHASIIESVDSVRLLEAIAAQAQKIGKIQRVLLQMHIASEEQKQGFSASEIRDILDGEPLAGVEVVGLMGMATFTDDMEMVRREFMELAELYNSYDELKMLSMGMSSDYHIAMECGSTNVRIGTALFEL